MKLVKDIVNNQNSKKISDKEAEEAFKIILRQDQDGLQIPFSKLKRFLNNDIQNQESEVSYYIGAGHVLLRETFIDVGGYDTELFYGLEELDISSEIIKENKKKDNVNCYPLA